MGGAAASYFLRQLLGSRVSITLFERSGRIGGRIRATDFANERKETGASIFHQSNYYMYSFAKQFALTIQDEQEHDSRLMFYAGPENLTFHSLGGPKFLVPLRLLWRYGTTLIKVRRFTNTLVKDFSKIYTIQERGYCFGTPAELFEALHPEFLEMTKWRYGDWLSQKLRVNDTFKEEVAYGLTSNNYCQNLNIHTFVGFITMATMIGKLYSIKGGNEQIPQKLVDCALRSNRLNNPSGLVHATVTSILPLSSSNSYQIEYQPSGGKKLERDIFDYVILALPLHQESNIKTDSSITLPSFKYHEMNTTLLCGSLINSKFGISSGAYNDNQIPVILPIRTCYEMGLSPFRSLISYGLNRKESDRIWSVHSEPMITPNPEKSIGQQFIQPAKAKMIPPLTVRWLAYPSYAPLQNPHVELGTFILAPRLYFVNAIEQMASCMEMAAIGGRNAALLVAADVAAADRRSGRKANEPVASLYSSG